MKDRNEAAERPHEPTGGNLNKCVCGDWHPMSFYLAAERKATVERIRAAIIGPPGTVPRSEQQVLRILDEEAAR